MLFPAVDGSFPHARVYMVGSGPTLCCAKLRAKDRKVSLFGGVKRVLSGDVTPLRWPTQPKRGAKGRSQRPRSMRPTRSSKGPMGTMLLLTTPLTRSRARWAGMPGVADAEAAHERAQINNVLFTRLPYSRYSRVGPRVVRGWFKYNKR